MGRILERHAHITSHTHTHTATTHTCDSLQFDEQHTSCVLPFLDYHTRVASGIDLASWRGGRSRHVNFANAVFVLRGFGVRFVRLLFALVLPVAWKAPRSRINSLVSVSFSSSEVHSAEHDVKSPSDGGSRSLAASSASMFPKACVRARSDSRASNASNTLGCTRMSHTHTSEQCYF